VQSNTYVLDTKKKQKNQTNTRITKLINAKMAKQKHEHENGKIKRTLLENFADKGNRIANRHRDF